MQQIKKKSCGCIWLRLSCLDWPGNRDVSLRPAAVLSFPLETRTQRTGPETGRNSSDGSQAALVPFQFSGSFILAFLHIDLPLPPPINPQGKWNFITLTHSALPSRFSSPSIPATHSIWLCVCVCSGRARTFQDRSNCFLPGSRCQARYVRPETGICQGGQMYDAGNPAQGEEEATGSGVTLGAS